MSSPNPGPRINLGAVARVCMALWFLATGLIVLFHLSMEALPVIMGILALIVGILLLLGW